METIGGVVSRLRKITKLNNPDSFYTNRDLYSIFLKYAYMYIRRQDNLNKIMKYNTIFQPFPCVELIEVDKVEACCLGIQSNCTIRRTKERLPKIVDGAYGPLFRSISSIDRSIEITLTYAATYVAMSKSKTFKYNTTKYCWYIDGYLYFPNLDWDAVLIEAVFEDDLSADSDCIDKTKTLVRIPPYLFPEIENGFKQDIAGAAQMPADPIIDKQNQSRQ
jgi:hypothetical protein